ncbi:MAG: ribonuclease III [Clostridia bacterium]|nr:ribonuclease III [Clostridia bacterium]
MEFSLNINEYSPLVLAYIGDAVYELFIRSKLIGEANAQPSRLHNESTYFVCAESQFNAFHIIENMLTDEEMSVLKRGRNAKSQTTPKNADVTHYRYATGIEALMGYLYIKGEKGRIEELMEVIYKALCEQKSKQAL